MMVMPHERHKSTGGGGDDDVIVMAARPPLRPKSNSNARLKTPQWLHRLPRRRGRRRHHPQSEARQQQENDAIIGSAGEESGLSLSERMKRRNKLARRRHRMVRARGRNTSAMRRHTANHTTINNSLFSLYDNIVPEPIRFGSARPGTSEGALKNFSSAVRPVSRDFSVLSSEDLYRPSTASSSISAMPSVWSSFSVSEEEQSMVQARPGSRSCRSSSTQSNHYNAFGRNYGSYRGGASYDSSSDEDDDDDNNNDDSDSDDEEDRRRQEEVAAAVAEKKVKAAYKMLPSTQTALAGLTLASTYGKIPAQKRVTSEMNNEPPIFSGNSGDGLRPQTRVFVRLNAYRRSAQRRKLLESRIQKAAVARQNMLQSAARGQDFVMLNKEMVGRHKRQENDSMLLEKTLRRQNQRTLVRQKREQILMDTFQSRLANLEKSTRERHRREKGRLSRTQRAKQQQQLLTICALARRTARLYGMIRQEHLARAAHERATSAASMIQRAWRQYFKYAIKYEEGRAWRDALICLRQNFRFSIIRLRVRLRNKKVDRIKEFLSNSAAVRSGRSLDFCKVIRLFRQRVLKVQGYVRAFVRCREARLLLLEKLWNRTAREIAVEIAESRMTHLELRMRQDAERAALINVIKKAKLENPSSAYRGKSAVSRTQRRRSSSGVPVTVKFMAPFLTGQVMLLRGNEVNAGGEAEAKLKAKKDDDDDDDDDAESRLICCERLQSLSLHELGFELIRAVESMDDRYMEKIMSRVRVHLNGHRLVEKYLNVDVSVEQKLTVLKKILHEQMASAQDIASMEHKFSMMRWRTQAPSLNTGDVRNLMARRGSTISATFAQKDIGRKPRFPLLRLLTGPQWDNEKWQKLVLAEMKRR